MIFIVWEVEVTVVYKNIKSMYPYSLNSQFKLICSELKG